MMTVVLNNRHRHVRLYYVYRMWRCGCSNLASDQFVFLPAYCDVIYRRNRFLLAYLKGADVKHAAKRKKCHVAASMAKS